VEGVICHRSAWEGGVMDENRVPWAPKTSVIKVHLILNTIFFKKMKVNPRKHPL
jgi:hypothetical protein